MQVSTIIPTFNNEGTLARAIASALAQDLDEPAEVIVVNDGSTDATAAILAGYGDRIRVIEQSNAGAAAARNAGASAARGDYLAFLDADDQWLPQKLRVMTAAMDRSPDAALAYSDFIVVSPAGTRTIKSPMRGSPTLDDLLDSGFGFFPTVVVIRRSVFNAGGGFCEEFRGAGFEDAYMALTMREQGEFVHVDQPLALYYEAAPAILAAKYRRGYRVLVRLVRERYGARGSRKLIARASTFYASLLVSAAAEQAKRKMFGRAAASLFKAATVKPGYFVELGRARSRGFTIRRSQRQKLNNLR
jgi:glycosyltransferase involved in cell wall biosynthesis